MQKEIRFNRKKGNYACFSNFHPCTVIYKGITYSNTEAAWQSLKALDSKKRQEFSELPGGAAKKKGRKVPLRQDWENVKYDLMVESKKFKQGLSIVAFNIVMNTTKC